MGDLTIDELARASGFTVRNIRSHTTRGLLPAPEVRGRTGYYGEEHLARLRLIKELQEDGLPLRLVERLVTSGADATTRLIELRRTVMTPLVAPEPVVVTLEELVERFGEFDAETLRMALSLEAIAPLPDGRFEAPQPGLLAIADAVMRHGVTLKDALAIGLRVRRLSGEAAETFVEMVRSQVWDPFDEAGRPEAQWPLIASAIEDVRPLAIEIFAELLPGAIATEIERVFGEVLRQAAEAAGSDAQG